MAKTVSEGFQSFLTRQQPLQTEHDKAGKHKNAIMSCVENRFGCYTLFETGSFGNGTGIRHFSDTDYFAPVKAGTMSVNSSVALRELKEALKVTFPNTTGIEVDSPAVQIPFGIYASETIEVTPCYFKGMSQTPLGNFPNYQIPNGAGAWMFSSPQAHTKYVNQINTNKGGKLKPLIQLVKAWKYLHDVPIISFYIELRTARFFETGIILSYDEALYNFFLSLYSMKLADMRDPMGISGLIPASKTGNKKATAFSKLATALSRVEKAYNARLKGNISEAFHYWSLFFNNEF